MQMLGKMQYVALYTIILYILHSFTVPDQRVFSYLKKFSLLFLLAISQVSLIVPTFIVPCDKNKTNHQISSNSHPSATANKAIHSLK